MATPVSRNRPALPTAEAWGANHCRGTGEPIAVEAQGEPITAEVQVDQSL